MSNSHRSVKLKRIYSICSKIKHKEKDAKLNDTRSKSIVNHIYLFNLNCDTDIIERKFT